MFVQLKKQTLYHFVIQRFYESKCWLTIVSEEMVVGTRMATHGFILAALCKYYVSLVTRKSQ